MNGDMELPFCLSSCCLLKVSRYWYDNYSINTVRCTEQLVCPRTMSIFEAVVSQMEFLERVAVEMSEAREVSTNEQWILRRDVGVYNDAAAYLILSQVYATNGSSTVKVS